MPLVGKSQYYSGFSPTSIPGCALWLDAADSSSLTLSGSNVTAWRDKSGNGRNFTATVGNFTYIQDQGRQIVNIPNTTYMTSTVPLTVTAATSWIFFVTKLGTTNDAYLVNFTPDGDEAIRYTYTGKYPVSPGPPGDANDIIGPLGTSYINGTLDTATVYTNYHQINGPVQTTRTTTSITISSPYGGRYYIGTLAEIIFYTGPVTGAQRQSVEGYLATKWGLKPNIPATHPFKTLPPFTRPFIPVDISGCGLWLDGSDPAGSGVRPADNSTLATWVDKSGNARNGTGGVSPTFSNNGVVFNGTNAFLTTTYSCFPAAESFFAVATFLGTTDANYGILGTGVTLGRGYNVNRGGGQTSVRWDKWAVNSYAATNGVQSNVRFLTSGIFTGTGGTTGLNGGAQSASAAFSYSGTGTSRIGSGLSADFYNGTINELIAYSVALPTAERQQVETYLANKWGLRGSTPAGHYARLAPALSTAFLPPQIGACTVWLDGADATAVTVSGSNVTQWNDKSGNGYHFTVPGGFTSPTYSSNAINGVNSLSFIGAGGENGKYNALVNSSVPINGTAYSIFAVVRRNVSAPSWTGANYILTSPTGSRLFYATYSGGFFTTSTGTSTSGFNPLDANVPNTTLTSTTLTGMVVNGVVLYPYVSGSAMTTKNGTTTAYSGLSIGDATGGPSGQCWSGFICEIVVYNIALTTPQRQQVEGYLANKWRLTASLPSGHPYKAFKP